LTVAVSGLVSLKKGKGYGPAPSKLAILTETLRSLSGMRRIPEIPERSPNHCGQLFNMMSQ
jgi:hypothetical protein